MFKTNRDLGLLILRVGASLLMLMHGIGKVQDLFSDPSGFPDPLGIGSTFSLILVVIAEFVAPIFIIIGYKTKLAAIPTLITMLVAAFVIHADDPFSDKEKAVLFALCFLVIAIAGPGKYALDKNS